MGFAHTRGLSDHKRMNHGYPKLRCKVEGCDAEFLFRSAFDNHVRKHQSKTECDECGKSMSPSYLATHKRLVHRGEKPHACKITDCTERFSRPEGLADHGRIVHGYPKLRCKVEDCGLEFLGYYDLKNHQRTHSKIECSECGIRLNKKTLSQHMRGVHQGERPYGCEITGCDKRLFTKTDLADHMRSVHGTPKLKCRIGECTAEFVYKRLFLMHAKQHLS